MRTAHYDLIIIGGGIAGAALAGLLTNSNLKIAIIDQQALSLSPLPTEYELRVSAITRTSQALFQKLQVWQTIQSLRISPYTQMFVWDASSEAHIQFSSEELGETDLGHIIENTAMQRALLEKLVEAKNVDLISATSLEKIEVHPSTVEVSLRNGLVLTANLVVGADGAHSKVRELAGIALDYQSYGHTAIVATVRCEKSHQQTAWQCFLPDGVLAFLPLPDLHTCSIVWSSNTQTAERLLKLDDMAFNIALADVFAKHLGKLELMSQRLSFPLVMRHARHYIAPRIALVGDAAHTIHPLAGQGLNLGLADASYLAQVILLNCQQQRDIGLVANLRVYERWRKKENLNMIAAMQGFKSLFGSSLMPLVWLRGKGLHFVNRTAWLKNALVRKAMGSNDYGHENATL